MFSIHLRRLLLPALVFSASLAFAGAPQQFSWQQAVLIGFRTVSDGSDCSSSVDYAPGQSNTQSATQVSSVQSTCSDSRIRQYTLRVGRQTYVLEPVLTGKQAAADSALVIGTLGYGVFFLRKKDVMANQLPGAPILIRSAGSGFQVKVGNRHSSYSLVEAR